MEFRLYHRLSLHLMLDVSILVFLDMEFRQSCNWIKPRAIDVSILVFLDMEFRLGIWALTLIRPGSFNPCFSGYGIQTGLAYPEKSRWMGFNPCFSGYGIQTLDSGRRWKRACLVSILVFLDMEFRPELKDFLNYPKCVSILVFLDMEFRPVFLSSCFVFCKSFNPCFSGYGIQTCR